MKTFIDSYNSDRIISIGIVAGEYSGDILGAGLIHNIKKRLKKVHFFGIGGPRMLEEHMESWYNMEDLSVIGIFEIVTKLPKLLNIRQNLINKFFKLKIDAFIGVDFPDFNIFLEKKLKKYGIPTIHYVSPSIWAWREKRIFSLRKATNNILSIFPFEKKLYTRLNIPCQFVGHTLADQIPLDPSQNCIRKKLGISKNACCLSILPGSRINEIKMLSYYFLETAKLLMRHYPNLIVFVSLVNQKCLKEFVNIASKSIVKLHIFVYQKSWEIMIASDISLLAAGTVTLECMLAKCPMVVAYRIHPLTFILIKYLIKISWISLPNILLNYSLVKEFIQDKCCPENLSNTLLHLLNDYSQRMILKKIFRQLHNTLRCNADEQAAVAVLKLINLY